MNMKKFFFAMTMILFSLPSFAQKTEYNAVLNTGLFAFYGPRVEKSSSINYSSQNRYTNNPYGSVPSSILGLAFNLKRITSYHLLFGFDLGYDYLRSGIKITGVWNDATTMEAKGISHVNQDFINLFPQIGYRFQVNKFSIDALIGFDLAYGFQLTEQGHATTTTGEKFTTSVDRGTTADFRPRIQAAVNWRRISGFLSYENGQIPYDIGTMGAKEIGVYARIWRIGLAYRLNGSSGKER